MRGLDKLREQVNRRRQELLKKRNLDGTFAEIRELLDRAVLEERKQLARDLDDDARFAEMQIGSLPPSTAQAVEELSEYNWRSPPQAREDYEKIKDLLGRELLDQRFAGMKEALEGATEADRQRVSDMLKDLNELLEAHNRGEDTSEMFDEFMDAHGDFFPENPRNTEELIDSLAQRAAAAQQFYNSLTPPEQQAELDQLAQQAFGSPDLMSQLAQMDSQLRAARPGLDWDNAQSFSGDQPMGLGGGCRGAPRHLRTGSVVRAVVPAVRRSADGRHRPRRSRTATRRRGGGRRADARRTRESAVGGGGVLRPCRGRATPVESQGDAATRAVDLP